MADRALTLADRGSVSGSVSAVTEMKSEAAVGADQRSAPHSSQRVLTASDNAGGDRQALAARRKSRVPQVAGFFQHGREELTHLGRRKTTTRKEHFQI